MDIIASDCLWKGSLWKYLIRPGYLFREQRTWKENSWKTISSTKNAKFWGPNHWAKATQCHSVVHASSLGVSSAEKEALELSLIALIRASRWMENFSKGLTGQTYLLGVLKTFQTWSRCLNVRNGNYVSSSQGTTGGHRSVTVLMPAWWKLDSTLAGI